MTQLEKCGDWPSFRHSSFDIYSSFTWLHLQRALENQMQRAWRVQPLVELSLQCAFGFGGQPALYCLLASEFG